MFLSQSLLVLIPFTFCISCNNHTCPLNTNNKVSQDENTAQMEMQNVFFWYSMYDKTTASHHKCERWVPGTSRGLIAISWWEKSSYNGNPTTQTTSPLFYIQTTITISKPVERKSIPHSSKKKTARGVSI